MNVNVPVGFNGQSIATMNISVEKSCVDGIAMVKITNNTGRVVDTKPLDKLFTAIPQENGETISVGIIGDKAITITVKVNVFTKAEFAVVYRDGIATALCKVHSRGGLWLNAMYRGDGANRVVVDRFTPDTKEMAAWRTPQSKPRSV